VIVYYLFRITIFLTSPLPLWLGYRVAAGVAEVCYHFFGRQRRGLNQNMAVVLNSDDPAEVDAHARRAFRNFGKFVIDFIHFPAMTRDEVHKRLVFYQWNELDDAVAAGKGVIMPTMHLGVWDLGAASLAAYGYPINAIVDTFSDEKLDALVHESRRNLGMNVITRDQAGPSLIRRVKRGEILAILIDVQPGDQTVEVEFMGKTATVSAIPARLALATGAKVVAALALRGQERDTAIRPVIEEVGARFEPSGDQDRDVRGLTQLMMDSFERLMVGYTDQWLLFHPLWLEEGQTAAIPVLAPQR
jgi:lauroyl/myristoyl acyltransferase